MHLGNIRTALLNYLFAHQKGGTFVLRIEDTDPERNFDPNATHIINDLIWLGLTYDEGPRVDGPYGPYFQSKRSDLYAKKLQELQDKNAVYRCFCTPEELERKRKRQLALKRPPRYDQTCLHLTDTQIAQKLDTEAPFIWRLNTTDNRTITFNDMARGTMEFHLKDFSDIPLTRTDGSFTFTFANCVDDGLMKITHVLRGEDHISNTTSQVVLYEALGLQVPTFWHIPIMCNIEGKKLSKRDFGFSLKDLQDAGFISEAILNYLGIIGGSFEQEIMSLEKLVQLFPFDAIHSTGHIKYDVEKLKWINHKWLSSYDTAQLTDMCLPRLIEAYPIAEAVNPETMRHLIGIIKPELVTLNDCVELIRFYFETPSVKQEQLKKTIRPEKHEALIAILKETVVSLDNPDTYMELTKQKAKSSGINSKELWSSVRFILTGNVEGMGIHDIIDLLGIEEVKKRIHSVLD